MIEEWCKIVTNIFTLVTYNRQYNVKPAHEQSRKNVRVLFFRTDKEWGREKIRRRKERRKKCDKDRLNSLYISA